MQKSKLETITSFFGFTISRTVIEHVAPFTVDEAKAEVAKKWESAKDKKIRIFNEEVTFSNKLAGEAREKMIAEHVPLTVAAELKHAEHVSQYKSEDLVDQFKAIFTVSGDDTDFLMFDDTKLLIQGIEKISCDKAGTKPVLLESVVDKTTIKCQYSFLRYTNQYSKFERPKGCRHGVGFYHQTPEAVYEPASISLQSMSGATHYVSVPAHLVDYALISLLALMKGNP